MTNARRYAYQTLRKYPHSLQLEGSALRSFIRDILANAYTTGFLNARHPIVSRKDSAIRLRIRNRRTAAARGRTR